MKKTLYFLLLCNVAHGQKLHHQNIGCQGITTTLNQVTVSQSIGQQSLTGNYKSSKFSVQQGYQQSIGETERLIKSMNISVYPNPTSDMINISFDKPIINLFNVKLYDVIGKMLKDQNFEPNDRNSYSLSLKDLPVSSYILSVQANRKLFNFKILKK